MKFTFSWLKDHLDTKLDVYKIADTLTNIGLEVESIQDRSIEFKSFSVGHVIKVGKHPNADRLKVCLVKTIKGKYQVVCGAPNVRIGMKGIFAPVNSFIPSTGIKLNKVKIRGVESSGMLVSEKEMGISDDHERIIEVKESQKIGESFAKNPLDNDHIAEQYEDTLSDIPFYQRQKIAQLYLFNLQPKLNKYIQHLYQLNQNSTSRIETNKSYQEFLKELKKKEDLDKETLDKYDLNDLQLTEATNILKDLIIIMDKEKQKEAA